MTHTQIINPFMGVVGFVNHEEVGMDFGTKWKEEKL